MNKNKKAVIAVASLLVVILLASVLSSCAGKGKTLLSLDGNVITENTYELMLTQQKGKMAYAIKSTYGDYNSENFWGMTVDYSTQKTNADVYNEAILEKAKTYLGALKLYDELAKTKSDFAFPEKYKNNIDTAIEDYINFDGKGSKSTLNSILSKYGINVDMLRDYLIMEAKIAYEIEYLYGSDGSKIGDAVKQEYFENNYVSCKQILLQKFYYIYETDEDGNEIYFDPETSHPIYDLTATPAFNEDGSDRRDKYNNQIYYNNDGSIAYDTEKGERRVCVDSATGLDVYEMYSAEELAGIKGKAAQLLSDAGKLSESEFDVLRKNESADYVVSDETEGRMYYASNVSYSVISSDYIDAIVKNLSEMKTGEVRLIESDLSYNIIMKTALVDGDYGEKKYEYYFSDTTYGVYDFLSNLKDDLFNTRIAPYVAEVKVDEERLENLKFSISDVEPNYYYPDPGTPYYAYDEYN